MSLQENLDAIRAAFEAGKPPHNAPRSVVETMQRATAELVSSGAASRARKVGDKAPHFSLEDADGRLVSSSALLASGPLIVSFYRGIWCPYCNTELRALEAARPEFEKLGATLVAISLQTPSSSRESARHNRLHFPILSDSNGKVSAAFGVRFKLRDYVIDLHRNLGNDLPAFNGDASWTLPMPARYVIDCDRTIRYAAVNPDHTRRPEPQELVPALQKAASLA